MTALLVITFVTSLPFFQAEAQTRCEQIFTAKATIYDRENWAPFNDLEIAAARLKSRLVEKRAEITSKELKLRTAHLEDLTEKYLQSAGIRFEKVPVSIKLKDLNDTPEFDLQYSAYRLLGTSTGVETSRLLHRVQSNTKFKNTPLTVELDLYYSLEGAALNRQAHYEIRARRIRFGPETLSDDLLGRTSNLTHEIHHYLEHMKISRGEMSLARLQLTSASPKQDAGGYGKFLSVDELETWLRDIRVLLNQPRHQARDQKYVQLIRPQVRGILTPFLAKDRLDSAQRGIDLMELLIQNTRQTLEAMILPDNLTSIDYFISGESRFFMQIALKESPYESLRFEFTGLIQPHETNSDKIGTVMQEFSDWNIARIDQIATELAELKIKLQSLQTK